MATMNRRESIKAALAGIGAAALGVLGFGKEVLAGDELDVLANHVCTEQALEEVRRVMPDSDDKVDMGMPSDRYFLVDGPNGTTWVCNRTGNTWLTYSISRAE